jgi:hypothetical protein
MFRQNEEHRQQSLFSAEKTLYSAALMVNLRRLHRHFEEKAEEATEEIASFLSLPEGALFCGWRSAFRHSLMLSTTRNARSAAD